MRCEGKSILSSDTPLLAAGYLIVKSDADCIKIERTGLAAAKKRGSVSRFWWDRLPACRLLCPLFRLAHRRAKEGE
jgi:hypothetical protein